MSSFQSNDYVVCPHCEHEHDPYESEDGELLNPETIEWQCEACGEVFQLSVQFTWVTTA